MARYAKPRPSRAPAAPLSRREKRRRRSANDQLFFSRLRGHAKWMFVALALVFAGGFVFFGVGSGSTGIGGGGHGGNGGGLFDFIRGGPRGLASVKKAEKQIRERPQDPNGYRALSTALQAAGKDTEAVAPLATYTKLRPSDLDALSQLGVLYLTAATRYRDQARVAQFEAQSVPSSSLFSPDPTSRLGQALPRDPVSDALSARASTNVNDAFGRMQRAFSDAVGVYKKITALEPADPTAELELANTAQSAGDTQTAIAAYKAFLKLAPNDPNAPAVKQQLALLQPAPATKPKVTVKKGSKATSR